MSWIRDKPAILPVSRTVVGEITATPDIGKQADAVATNLDAESIAASVRRPAAADHR